MFTETQMAWAAQHDWYVVQKDGMPVVVDRQYSRDSGYEEEMVFWTGSFQELREWAGY